ncbi:unnamed protein product [Didymodactylos carnosus]|nr:unnamed protein product [Didymodactylos carnosus]CAF4412156.1 unnamed protein product [Didymodactylos carnosus]
MVPILSITTVNFILYSYTMIRLAIKNRLQVGLRSTISEHQRRTQNLKIGLFFAIIMGLTWSFGFLLLISNTVVQLIGNILFCITNTIQGFCFFLMVFWMIEQNKTRDQLRICCNYCIGNMKQRQPQVRMKVLKTSSSNTTCSTDEQTQKEPKAFGSVQNRRIIETQLDDHTYTSLF